MDEAALALVMKAHRERAAVVAHLYVLRQPALSPVDRAFLARHAQALDLISLERWLVHPGAAESRRDAVAELTRRAEADASTRVAIAAHLAHALPKLDADARATVAHLAAPTHATSKAPSKSAGAASFARAGAAQRAEPTGELDFGLEDVQLEFAAPPGEAPPPPPNLAALLAADDFAALLERLATASDDAQRALIASLRDALATKSDQASRAASICLSLHEPPSLEDAVATLHALADLRDHDPRSA